MHTVVILGTGTGVGKTYVTRALIDLLVGHCSGPVIALKPIESGLGAEGPTDAAVLAAHSRPSFEPSHAYGLREAVSPHLAARSEGVEIQLERVEAWVQQRSNCLTFQSADSWVLVETAGGVFTPLTADATNAQLASRLEPAVWVLVAPDRLGVLHDLTATLIALDKTARTPDLVLLNAPEMDDASTGKNRAEIERLGIAHVVARVDRHAVIDGSDRAQLLTRLEQGAKPVTSRGH